MRKSRRTNRPISGDANRWADILDGAARSIQNIICARFPNTSSEERKDIQQEVHLKLWRMISRGKKIDNLRSYLWRVVFTTALDVIGDRIPGPSGDVAAFDAERIPSHRLDDLSPERQLEDKEMRQFIHRGVADLPSRRRAVVELWLCDMDLEEIAVELRWNRNQVRHLLYRGIEDIRGMLKGRLKSGQGERA